MAAGGLMRMIWRASPPLSSGRTLCVLRDALVRVAPAGTVAALTGERVAEAFEIPPHLLRSHRDEPVPLTPQEYQTLAAQYPVDPLSTNW